MTKEISISPIQSQAHSTKQTNIIGATRLYHHPIYDLGELDFTINTSLYQKPSFIIKSILQTKKKDTEA